MSQVPSQEPRFPLNETAFLSTLRALLTHRGKTAAAAVLSPPARVAIEYRDYDNWNGGTDVWGITVTLPLGDYARLGKGEVEAVERCLMEHMGELLRGRSNDRAGSACIQPIIGADLAVVRSVNNQANVRAVSPPHITHDDLGFRSRAEVNLYKALKRLDVTFAPLPVFIRGAVRREPDFILIKDGFIMLVEVDGPDSHPEMPVEAERRLAIFKDEGVRIERVSTAECESDADAEKCAARLAAKFERYRSQR